MIVLVALAAFVPGLGRIPPTDRDEARFAQASRQMLASGDLVDIQFQNEPRYKKPIGIYWLQAGSAAIVGWLTDQASPPIYAYRLPSLAAAILAALITGWIGLALFGPAVGLASGIMLATTLLVTVEARLAKTDATLLALSLIMQAVLAQTWMTRKSATDRQLAPSTAVLFWIAGGAGVLVKGPVVLLIPVCTILALSILERRADWLKPLRPLTGLAVAAAIIVPWMLAIAVRSQGAFVDDAIGQDLFSKLTGSDDTHVLWPGFYVLTFALVFWPWGGLVVLALAFAWRRRHDERVHFLLAWIIPAGIALELTPAKLLHYPLPIYPAVAIVAAMAFVEGYGQPNRRPPSGGTMWVATALTVTITALLGLAITLSGPFLLGEDLDWTVVIALPVMGLLTIAGIVLLRTGHKTGTIATFTALSLSVYGLTYHRILPSLDALWVSRQMERAVRQYAPCPQTRLITAGYSEPSLVFLVGTETVLASSGEEAANRFAKSGKCTLAMIEEDQLDAFHDQLRQVNRTAFGHSIIIGFNYANGRDVFIHVFTLNKNT